MMKKLSKIALLAAASAFMLAVFPACGDDDEEDDPSVKIVTNAESMTVEVDGTIDLMASVSDFPEGEVTYEWKSDKTDIAKVEQDPTNKALAQVKAVAAGTAKITVTAKSGSTTATAEVTVTVKEGESQISQPSVKIVTEATSMTVGVDGTIDLMASVSNFPESEVTYAWNSDKTDIATVTQNPSNTSQAQVKALAAGSAKITVTATVGDTTATADVTVTVTAEGGGNESDDKNPDKNATATFTFLSGEYTNSSTAVAAEGFFDGAKDGSLAVTVSAVELQLYKTEGGWTAIDPSASSTKAAGGANMGGTGGPASVQAQLKTKNDAVANKSNEVFGENGYEMGRIKLVVTTSESAVVLKKISGYFGSGKSFAKGYVKVDGNEYKEITETTALGTKGFSVDGFEVNQTIPANNTKDVYILLGKVATSAPSAGGTIDVAKLVYEFAAAEN